MHTISPYTLRCYNPDIKGVPNEEKYHVLDKVGQYDVYDILKAFAESKKGKFTLIEESKQIYRFNSFSFDDGVRRIRGVFEAGKYGYKSNIINIDTGDVDFTKLEKNAEIFEYYFDILLPAGCNEGICLMLNHNGEGVKTLFHNVIAANFRGCTGKVLQMNPMSYAAAYREWATAAAKEIKLVKFNRCDDIADRLARMGHAEQTLVISSTKSKNLGKLEDYYTDGTEQHALVEHISPMCHQVRATVSRNGRTKTFRFGSDLADQVCQIELDENEVPNIAGNPDIASLKDWCNRLMIELGDGLYPGAGVRI